MFGWVKRMMICGGGQLSQNSDVVRPEPPVLPGLQTQHSPTLTDTLDGAPRQSPPHEQLMSDDSRTDSSPPPRVGKSRTVPQPFTPSERKAAELFETFKAHRTGNGPLSARQLYGSDSHSHPSEHSSVDIDQGTLRSGDARGVTPMPDSAVANARKTPATPFDGLAKVIDASRKPIQSSLDATGEPLAMELMRLESGQNVMFFRDGQVCIDMGPSEGLLGRGGFKTVTKVLDYDQNKVFAHLKATSFDQSAAMNKEIDAYKRFSNKPGLPSLINIGETGLATKSISLIQKMYAGDARQQLETFDTREKRLDFAIEVLSGLKVMHDEGWVHADIKLDNMLVDDEGRGVLTDFGLASDSDTSWRGTAGYMHPHMLKNAATKSSRMAMADIAQGQRFDTYAMGLSLGILFQDPAALLTIRANRRAVDAYKSRQGSKMRDWVKQAHQAYRDRMAKLSEGDALPEAHVVHEMMHPDDTKIAPIGSYLARLREARAAIGTDAT